MAADTALKRYSAMNISSPWRGLNVAPDVTIPQGERQAVMFFYSGILWGEAPETGSGGEESFIGAIQNDLMIFNSSMGPS